MGLKFFTLRKSVDEENMGWEWKKEFCIEKLGKLKDIKIKKTWNWKDEEENLTTDHKSFS